MWHSRAVEERTKDKIEDSATALVEAGVSLIPFVGGPAAVFVNRAFGSATQRRNEILFAELSERIETVVVGLEALKVEELLQSEDFQAAAHRVFRGSQETASSAKRRLLQNALLNGYMREEPLSEREEFLAVMLRYVPEHVVVLQAMTDIMIGRDTAISHAPSALTNRLGDEVPVEVVRRCVEDLADDHLLAKYEESRVVERSVPRGGAVRRRETEQSVRTEVRHGITERGKKFLAFLAEPAP